MQQTRNKIVHKFVRRSVQHRKFSKRFCIQSESQVQTRSRKGQFKPVPSRTAAFVRSAISTLTHIANNLITPAVSYIYNQ